MKSFADCHKNIFSPKVLNPFYFDTNLSRNIYVALLLQAIDLQENNIQNKCNCLIS